MFRFEKLDVWHEAIAYADMVYEITDKFPSDERFGLTNQMRRAAVSISSNIAEGNGRASDSEYAHFLSIAYGSLMETVSQAHLANRRKFLNDQQFQSLCDRAEKVARMLSGLRKSIRPN